MGRCTCHRLLDRPQSVQLGTCGDGGDACSGDEEFIDYVLSDGVSGDRQDLDVRITDDPEPVLEWVPMQARALRSTATIFDRDPQCTPTPESCDDREQLCVDQADYGLCCGGTDDLAVLRETFQTEGPGKSFSWEITNGATPIWWPIGTDSGGESRWKARWIRYRWDQDNANTRRPIALEVGDVGDCNMIDAQCVEWLRPFC